MQYEKTITKPWNLNHAPNAVVLNMEPGFLVISLAGLVYAFHFYWAFGMGCISLNGP